MEKTDMEKSSSNWYLLYTKPRQEDLALENLERQGYHCYLPRINVEKLRRRRSTVITEPLFPRYLFIQLSTHSDGQSWSPVRSTTGVSKIVYFGMCPAQVDDALVRQIRQRENIAQCLERFNPGENVRITAGPFSGMEAVYQGKSADERCIVLLTLLHRQTSMHVDSAELAEIS